LARKLDVDQEDAYENDDVELPDDLADAWAAVLIDFTNRVERRKLMEIEEALADAKELCYSVAPEELRDARLHLGLGSRPPLAIELPRPLRWQRSEPDTTTQAQCIAFPNRRGQRNRSTPLALLCAFVPL
jgi:hypothetical protein